ncbi:hypothetical protein GJ629_15350 [Halapricum sp. CBA1109]|uniref:hypothetical protein n=1 Tax=Halapricum sp. CBA1109 TaxID=2668068 RepID=UPI0012FB8CEA|nr:hypothetical protein [Halapricum sp. CBA1109]MUV91094.1 hypothetical protein [Halapricum sp. CBA1109]
MSSEDERPRIEDTEGLTQETRTKQILEQRTKLVDVRSQVKHELHRDAIGRFEAETLFRDSLESYLLTIEPLFLNHGDGRFWHQAELGRFEAAPDEPGAPSRTIEATGLVSILNLPNPISVEWDGKRSDVLGGRTERRSVDVQIPFDVLDTALRKTNYALSEFGFVLDVEDNSDEWEI